MKLRILNRLAGIAVAMAPMILVVLVVTAIFWGIATLNKLVSDQLVTFIYMWSLLCLYLLQSLLLSEMSHTKRVSGEQIHANES